jgi:hypothetical protein
VARTHGRIKVEVWDVGSDFRYLSVDAQWAYEMLISQPTISVCGTLPFAPKKWAKLAADLSVKRVEDAVSELEGNWYVIVDHETDELLVRTMVKHDRAWNIPNLVTKARRQFLEIESEPIRSYLAQRHEWLANGAMEPEEVREYEEKRELESASQRTMPLPLERTSEGAS